MRAHLQSSCHERAVKRAALTVSKLVFRNDVRVELARQRRVDPWAASLWGLHAEIEGEFAAAPWTVMEYVRDTLAIARRVHGRHMRIWWSSVVRRLPLPWDILGEIYGCLDVRPPRRPRRPPRPLSFKSGNLNRPNCDSRAVCRRRRTTTSSPVLDFKDTMRTWNVTSARCAPRTDCDSCAWTRIELRVANMRISFTSADADQPFRGYYLCSACGPDTRVYNGDPQAQRDRQGESRGAVARLRDV